MYIKYCIYSDRWNFYTIFKSISILFWILLFFKCKLFVFYNFFFVLFFTQTNIYDCFFLILLCYCKPFVKTLTLIRQKCPVVINRTILFHYVVFGAFEKQKFRLGGYLCCGYDIKMLLLETPHNKSPCIPITRVLRRSIWR